MSFSRTAGLAGIGFVAVVVAANVVLGAAGLPSAGAPSAEVEAFFASNAVAVGAASMLAPVAWFLLAIFGAGALRHLLPAEHARGSAWAIVGLIGLVFQDAVFAIVTSTQVALLGGYSDALWNLHNAIFGLNGLGLVTALVAWSIAGRRTGFMRTWQWVLGFCAAALLFVSVLATPLDVTGSAPAILGILSPIGFLGWLVWVAGFGAGLARNRVAS